MKKVYETPIAFEEQFQANSYVAKCDASITTVAGNNGMTCINPEHDSKRDDNHTGYFGYVWVAADNTSCNIIVTNDVKTEINTNIFGAKLSTNPKKNATVYMLGVNNTATCTEYGGYKSLAQYYQPAFVNQQGENSPCYGSYIYEGTIDTIIQPGIFS